METRKGYPFSRRAYKQGWGILSKSIFGLLGLGACAAKGIKDVVESNAVSDNNNTRDSAIPNIETKNKVPNKSNNNENGKRITSDDIIDGNLRCLTIENYTISVGDDSYYSAHLSCCKECDKRPHYYINIGIMQCNYVYAFKGELMLVKLNNGDIFEFKNILENKYKKRRFGVSIELSYFISEEQIKKLSENKITKMRISVGNKYKDIDVSNYDLSMYILESYLKIKDRLSKETSIYEGF